MNPKDIELLAIQIKGTLWELSLEQQNKGNYALHYVLDDLCNKADTVKMYISSTKPKDMWVDVSKDISIKEKE